MMSKLKRNISKPRRDKGKSLRNCKKNKIRKRRGSAQQVKLKVLLKKGLMKMMRWMMMTISLFWIIRGGRKN